MSASEVPCRVSADLRAYEQKQEEYTPPPDWAVADKKLELAIAFLKHEENAHEAISESITSAWMYWKPFYLAIEEDDTAYLGLLLRRELMKYAESCTAKALQTWVDDYRAEE